MSLKFPEVSVPLRTLFFERSQGAYPTSVEQKLRGPLDRSGLCPLLRPRHALARRGLSLGSATGDQPQLSRHTPLALRLFHRVPITLEFQLET